MPIAEAQAYRTSLRSVRSVLERAGGAARVSRRDLEACRADLLVVRRTADRARAAESLIAGLFELSDDVAALLARLAAEEPPSARERPLSDRGGERLSA
jgi:hypothetical protein